MIEVCLLGTGGMMPMPNRFLTSLMLRYNGGSILVDCGEATQIAMKKRGWSPRQIDYICFTHFHADHISGLPGMLLSMSNAERREEVTIIGPRGLTYICESLMAICPRLLFKVRFHEFSEAQETFLPDELLMPDLTVTGFKVKHNMPCYGYRFDLARGGRFNADAAKAAGIELKYWNPLQKGKTIVTDDGRTLTPDMVLGPSRKGLRLTYTTDTRPTKSIVQNAKDADLFICEGMYGEPDKLEKAKEHMHMTMYEAAEIAVQARPKEMWLTHYSPSMVNPSQFRDAVRKIYPHTVTAKDGRTFMLRFEDEDEGNEDEGNEDGFKTAGEQGVKS